MKPSACALLGALLVCASPSAALPPTVFNCWGGGRCNDRAISSETWVTPMHIDYSPVTGKLVVADYAKQIREELANGVVHLVATTTNPPTAASYAPTGEIVYATDGGLLFFHDASGEHAINAGGLMRVQDVAICDGALWVADMYYDSSYPERGGIFKVAWPPTGAPPTRVLRSGVPSSGAPVFQPQGVACGAGGTLLIADTANNRVVRLTSSSGLSTVAGPSAPDASGRYPRGFAGDGGPAVGALFASPLDIAEASDGSVFINDYGNHRTRRVDTAGLVTTVLGNGLTNNSGATNPVPGQPPTSFPQTQPLGIALAGDVLKVSSASDQRIRCVTNATGPPMSPATATSTVTPLVVATATRTSSATPTLRPCLATATVAPTGTPQPPCQGGG